MARIAKKKSLKEIKINDPKTRKKLLKTTHQTRGT